MHDVINVGFERLPSMQQMTNTTVTTPLRIPEPTGSTYFAHYPSSEGRAAHRVGSLQLEDGVTSLQPEARLALKKGLIAFAVPWKPAALVMSDYLNQLKISARENVERRR